MEQVKAMNWLALQLVARPARALGTEREPRSPMQIENSCQPVTAGCPGVATAGAAFAAGAVDIVVDWVVGGDVVVDAEVVVIALVVGAAVVGAAVVDTAVVGTAVVVGGGMVGAATVATTTTFAVALDVARTIVVVLVVVVVVVLVVDAGVVVVPTAESVVDVGGAEDVVVDVVDAGNGRSLLVTVQVFDTPSALVPEQSAE